MLCAFVLFGAALLGYQLHLGSIFLSLSLPSFACCAGGKKVLWSIKIARKDMKTPSKENYSRENRAFQLCSWHINHQDTCSHNINTTCLLRQLDAAILCSFWRRCLEIFFTLRVHLSHKCWQIADQIHANACHSG